MIPYIIMFIALFFIWMILRASLPNERKADKVFTVIAAISVILLLGLRHPSMGIDLGYDTGEGYLVSFLKLKNYSWENLISMNGYHGYELGFVLFTKFIGMFTEDIQVYLFICTALSLIPVFYTIYKFSRNSFVSLIAFTCMPVFLIYFSGLRQAIAISFTFFSSKFIKEKKIIPFILTIAVAFVFHSSVWVFLFAYPIYNIKVKTFARYVGIFVLPFVFVIRKPIFSLLSSIIKGKVSIDNNGAFALLLLLLLIYFYCFVFSDKDDYNQNGLLNLFYLSCFCQLFGGLNSIALRIGYFFIMYLALLLPEVFSSIKRKCGTKDYIIHMAVICTGLLIFGLYNLYSTSWSMSYPYYFCWQAI